MKPGSASSRGLRIYSNPVRRYAGRGVLFELMINAKVKGKRGQNDWEQSRGTAVMRNEGGFVLRRRGCEVRTPIAEPPVMLCRS